MEHDNDAIGAVGRVLRYHSGPQCGDRCRAQQRRRTRRTGRRLPGSFRGNRRQQPRLARWHTDADRRRDCRQGPRRACSMLQISRTSSRCHTRPAPPRCRRPATSIPAEFATSRCSARCTVTAARAECRSWQRFGGCPGIAAAMSRSPRSTASTRRSPRFPPNSTGCRTFVHALPHSEFRHFQLSGHRRHQPHEHACLRGSHRHQHPLHRLLALVEADAAGSYPFKNRIPAEIVAIFEKHGFIWGGRWYHYDTMHFEYRPELIGPGR